MDKVYKGKIENFCWDCDDQLRQAFNETCDVSNKYQDGCFLQNNFKKKSLIEKIEQLEQQIKEYERVINLLGFSTGDCDFCKFKVCHDEMGDGCSDRAAMERADEEARRIFKKYDKEQHGTANIND